MATNQPARNSFQALTRFPDDTGSWEFVGHLLIALSAQGISELWRREESARRLNESLLVIWKHANKKANRFQVKNMKSKARAFRCIQFAVTPSLRGHFSNFWAYAKEHGLRYCPDGRCLMLHSQPHAQVLLEREFTWEYQRFLSACALLIWCKLYGRSNTP